MHIGETGYTFRLACPKRSFNYVLAVGTQDIIQGKKGILSPAIIFKIIYDYIS